MEAEREIAISILSEFEELLNNHDITIPDEHREGEEEEARLFGATYYSLEDKVTEIIKNFMLTKSKGGLENATRRT